MKKRPRGKLTGEQLTPYVADRSYQSMKTAKISLTKRAESMKVSLPTLKCLEGVK